MSYITYELLPSTQYIVLILIYVVSVSKCKMVKHYLATQWLVSLTSAHFTDGPAAGLSVTSSVSPEGCSSGLPDWLSLQLLGPLPLASLWW